MSVKVNAQGTSGVVHELVLYAGFMIEYADPITDSGGLKSVLKAYTQMTDTGVKNAFVFGLNFSDEAEDAAKYYGDNGYRINLIKLQEK